MDSFHPTEIQWHRIIKSDPQNILSKFTISGYRKRSASGELVNLDKLMKNVQFVPAAGLGYAQR